MLSSFTSTHITLLHMTQNFWSSSYMSSVPFIAIRQPARMNLAYVCTHSFQMVRAKQQKWKQFELKKKQIYKYIGQRNPKRLYGTW